MTPRLAPTPVVEVEVTRQILEAALHLPLHSRIVGAEWDAQYEKVLLSIANPALPERVDGKRVSVTVHTIAAHFVDERFEVLL